MSMADKLMTRPEAAEYLGVKPRTLEIWAVTGRYSLPYIRIGRRVRYWKSDLDMLLKTKKIFPVDRQK